MYKSKDWSNPEKLGCPLDRAIVLALMPDGYYEPLDEYQEKLGPRRRTSRLIVLGAIRRMKQQ